MAHKVIISGGGTGGHVFPAIAIANALRRAEPDIEILFVGALNKMEMEKVPEAGYEIIGLDIQGLNRSSILKNLSLPFKLLGSLVKARQILKNFEADIAVGVGGYASGPLLFMANTLRLPTVLQEQNSYAGITNKKLGEKAKRIFVAYSGMEKFFPAERILLTGNPIRKSSVDIAGKRREATAFFGLEADRKTVLVTGGSLGAGTLNSCVEQGIRKLVDAELQVIWQCGGHYIEELQKKLGGCLPESIKLMPFVSRMDYAYAAADVIVARAGAGTISELCVVGKPVVLVPSPNVAEDHQTKNAKALVEQKAAVMMSDEEAVNGLVDAVVELSTNEMKMLELGSQIKKMARPDADDVIAMEILEILR